MEPVLPALFDRLSALADPTRCRLLLALEAQELAVHELRTALQLPQSTVSRHLKLLADEGWVASRADGTTNWYRMAERGLDGDARELWRVVRDQFASSPAATRDAGRVRSIVAERHARSQEFFAASAREWDRLRVEMFGAGVERLALSCLVDPCWTVGDLGTGTGQLAVSLAPLARRVIAVDESPAMLEAAAARLAGLSNVELRQGTLEALPIESATLDLGLVVLVLHHLGQPDRAIGEAARALKPGGRIVVVDMMPHERVEYREAMGHQWLGFEQALVTGWLEAAGLDRASYRPLPADPDGKGPPLFGAAAVKPETAAPEATSTKETGSWEQ